MEVEIFDMSRALNSDPTLAFFHCSVDGWAIYGCRVAAAPDGFLQVAGPKCASRKSPRRRAVEPPREVWLAIVAAALETYAALPARVDDGGDALRDAVMEMVG